MASQKIVVAFLLIAAFALPAFAFFEKDVISLEALQAILNRKAPLSNIMMENDAIVNVIANVKTVISNPVLEEALLKTMTNHGVNGDFCGETCSFVPCFSSSRGCGCTYMSGGMVCVKNSLGN